ncbi:hypothetical protein UA08_00217 [Talaromyces atroroseus]|uniref:Uncharacterized protein n=1 Tax=Talaromyces atroroseus TaxID=1441469 RepID=A0A225AS44_TALAT|nr:hypothetical protein UA08_00217 [Talaromyces atroroseus]OKL64411.1 hypothetical protein UA08_00217 [Talaromyces atroroseus]
MSDDVIGAAQAMISNTNAALKTAYPILPRLAIPNSALASCPQALYWSELFLCKIAMLASKGMSFNEPSENEFEIEIALKAFRLWSGHPHVKRRDIAAGQTPTHTAGIYQSEPQSSVWMSYYKLLSVILRHGLPYFPLSPGTPRRQLANEIRRVETVCESVLLRETKFPVASDSNPQVEAWTEEVIKNWEVLCGPGWRNDDLDGGQDAVSRNVLDILYRAATETYHSHTILRRLFHVHATLAEFDLAIKALDTYVEIVVSAKDRAEKAAEIGDLESDETLLQTVSEGVLLLCCFGSENEARKAKELIPILEKYIEKDIADDLTLANEIAPRVSLRVVAMAYKAIGIGLASWSRWTPINEIRNDIRAEAIENLERSLAPEFQSQYDLSTRYALALLLAESRDLDGAISHVRLALTPREERTQSTPVTYAPHQTTLSQERDKIPLWHLLALLLSAKQEFDIAGRTCEAAFDQLPSSVNALAHNARRNNREGEKQTKKDWIKHLQSREKERIIETRMTQLALLEITDGSEVAVNHSDNLLALFATLFEDLELEITTEKASKPQQQLEPPKSSAGTVKSFRGSIFGRKRGSKVPSNAGEIPPLPNGGLPNASADAPTIRVTPESANGTQQGQQQKHQLEKSQQAVPINATDGEPSAGNGSINEQESPEKIGIAISNISGSPMPPTRPKESAKQQLPSVAHNVNSKHQPLPAGHTKQPPEQDVRLPNVHRFDSPTNALLVFPTLQTQKHALSVLVKVWLLISGLYRRASLFEDAREACEEASKQANAFEALVAAQESSARAFDQRVWGVAKSVEELWGDVYAEKGALSEAQSMFQEAMQYYEEAIARYPDHPKATIGLSNLLLDFWEEKIPLEPLRPQLDTDFVKSSCFEHKTHSHINDSETFPESAPANSNTNTSPVSAVETKKSANAPINDDKPGYLSRQAARDRAYGLLSMLTKTGSAWDNSEAWFTLARAHEAGSQIEKAKEILWWCIELEDEKPIRHWWNLGAGGNFQAI